MTTISEQVNEMRAARSPRRDGEPPNPFEVEQARLAAAGVPQAALAAGTSIANVDLLDVDGSPTTLFAALGDRRTVVVLYRGAWCPYCSVALRTYQAELVPALDRHGAAHLVAVSPQTPDGSLSTKEKNELTFTVLSDPGNQIAHQLGVVTAPSPHALELQRSHGLDLAEHNADGTTELPMPTTVIVDQDHVVRWIDVHPDYTTRSEPAEIIAALEAL
jgi:peroxiredoxin